uniref:Uncharacterized protein n=1 Tax=Ditylenchus dipsaci TaxID=166011 RepID=A0A915D7I6_9BILA
MEAIMQTINEHTIDQQQQNEDDDYIEFIERPERDEVKLEYPNDFGEHTNNTDFASTSSSHYNHQQESFSLSDSLNELANAKRADEKFELVCLIRSKYNILYGKNVERGIKEATWQWILDECLRRGHCWAVGKEANYMRKSKWPGIKADALKRYNEELVTGKANSIQLAVRNTTSSSPHVVFSTSVTESVTDRQNNMANITDLNSITIGCSSSGQQQQPDHQSKFFSDHPAWQPISSKPDELLDLQKQCLHSKMQKNRLQARYYRLKSMLVKRQLEDMDKKDGGSNNR